MKYLIHLLLSNLVLLHAFSQSAFRNLGFESARVPELPAGQGGSLVPVADAFRVWRVTSGTTELTEVFHNNVSIGTPMASILGPNYSFPGILEGQYTALIVSGIGPDLSISQSGLVPLETKSLTFKALSSGMFGVTLGGVELKLIELERNDRFSVYGADIFQFAGRLEELRFSALTTPLGSSSLYLDSIEFSPVAIPEPNIYALLALGLTGMLAFFHLTLSHRISKFIALKVFFEILFELRRDVA